MDFRKLWLWGFLALFAIIPPLLTSNNFFRNLLKRRWKTVQKLSYIAFILTGVHVVIAKNSWIEGVLLVSVWLLFWVYAEFKKR